MPRGQQAAAVAHQNQQDQQDQAQDNEELQSAVERLGIRSYPPPTRLFTIKRIAPAKGLGWVANRTIVRGTPLLAEREIFFAIEGYSEEEIASERNRLFPLAQAGFDALTCQGGAVTPMGIFDRNSFEMHKTQRGRQKSGLFLEAARINHSCTPNAFHMWNRTLKRLTIYAAVEIAKADEITINYRTDDIYRTRIQRNVELNHWGFRCDCKACQPGTLFGNDSDARRLQMGRLQNRIDTHNHAATSPIQRLHDICLLEDLLRREELIYPMVANMFRLKAQWYESTLVDDARRAASYEGGNRQTALEFARQELDLDLICNGHTSPEVEKTLKFIRQLRG